MFNNFFFSENRTVYEIMSKNVVKTKGPEITSQCSCVHAHTYVACRISKASCTYAHAHAHARWYLHACTHRPVSNTYSFSMAPMIHKHASVLHYTYIAPLT
jgi:hypothetical protein